MRSFAALGCLGFILLTSAVADAATVTGAVTGPDGAPFRAAFVQARHAGMKMTVSVLTDNQGKYFIENLPAGEYRLQVRAIGYKADAKTGLQLAADQNAAANFTLQAGTVRWSDISLLQGWRLLPNERGKETLFENCFACHGFQSKMAAVVRDEDGWRDRVTFMRQAMLASQVNRQGFSDKDAEDIVFYLNRMFSEDSVLPKSPTALPNYKDTLIQFSDEALKIVYVDFELPGPNRFPFSSIADKDGLRWTPEFGLANKIMRLDPKTGAMAEFPVPNMGPAIVHSAVPAPDGSVWLAENGSKKLGRWDPVTQKVTEFQDNWGKHTVRVAPDGRIWSSGGLTVFDPKSETFTHIPEVPSSYGIALDQQDNVWFTDRNKRGILGKVDAKTLKVTKYIPPMRDGPRRIQIDDDGMVWICVYEDGKIDRFDPKTETFKEFALPDPKTQPYAFAIAADRTLWYSSYSRDVMGRLDPNTGKVTEYPMPYTDNGMRDFFPDQDGHLWYGAPTNNRVGYFYLSTKQRDAQAH